MELLYVSHDEGDEESYCMSVMMRVTRRAIVCQS